MKVTYKDVIPLAAKELGMNPEFVTKVYSSYWRSIRQYISSLPLNEDLTEEEFSKLKPNINIPSLGKFYVLYDKFKKQKEWYKCTAKQ